MKPFNADGAFVSPLSGSGRRRRAVRSAGITILSQGLTFIIQMIATVALARLLTPADFGLVTMVTTFSILLMSCGQVGFPDAVLQRDEINHCLASNLFWINIGIALILTVGFAATGSLLAGFYGDLRITKVAAGISLTILINSASVLHLALLQRAMRFPAVSANNIIARAVAVAVSILFASFGWGYWALIAGSLSQVISCAIGAWVLCRWVPSLPRRVSGTETMVQFAAYVYARYSLGYMSQNTDNLLVGWRFGSATLGLYKRAYDLFILPLSFLQIYAVAVSTLSRLRDDAVQYRRYLLGGLSTLCLVGMAAAGALTLVGKDLVRIVLGPQWEMSGRIFTFFGPGIGLMLIYSTHGMIHLSIGTTRRFLRWGIIEIIVTIALLFCALPWGPAGMAVAWTTSYMLLIIPAFWYAGRPIDLTLSMVVGVIWKFAAAALLAGCGSFLIIRQISYLDVVTGSAGALFRLVVNSLVFAILYVSAIVLIHGGFGPLNQFGMLITDLLPRRRHTGDTQRLDPSVPKNLECSKNMQIAL